MESRIWFHLTCIILSYFDILSNLISNLVLRFSCAWTLQYHSISYLSRNIKRKKRKIIMASRLSFLIKYIYVFCKHNSALDRYYRSMYVVSISDGKSLFASALNMRWQSFFPFGCVGRVPHPLCTFGISFCKKYESLHALPNGFGLDAYVSNLWNICT